MRKINRLVRGTTIALLSLLAVGCASAPEPYADRYRKALEDSAPHAVAAQAAPLAPFIALFSDLQGERLRERLDATYAAELYFNDTVHTHTRRDALFDYLADTAQRAEQIVVEVDQILRQDQDVFVRWRMRTLFRIAGSEKDVSTIGMTHLRFNDQGHVIVHQDFWDSTEGIYRHVPFVGGLVNWVSGKL